MTYNILNGGQDDFQFDRLNIIIRIIKSVDPDVLVLQEGMYFDLNGGRILYRIENETGLRGILAHTKTGQHVATFLRKDARIAENYIDTEHFHHAMIRTIIFLQNNDLLTIIGTHLCPHGGEKRVSEVQYAANYARKGELVLLLGDMNALSPSDNYTDSISRLPSHYRTRYLMPSDNTTIDIRAIRTLETASFIDLHVLKSTSSIEYTAPTKLGQGKEFSKMRVDYIFGTPRIADTTSTCYVLKTSDTEIASDHYPVIAELQLEY